MKRAKGSCIISRSALPAAETSTARRDAVILLSPARCLKVKKPGVTCRRYRLALGDPFEPLLNTAKQFATGLSLVQWPNQGKHGTEFASMAFTATAAGRRRARQSLFRARSGSAFNGALSTLKVRKFFSKIFSPRALLQKSLLVHVCIHGPPSHRPSACMSKIEPRSGWSGIHPECTQTN